VRVQRSPRRVAPHYALESLLKAFHEFVLTVDSEGVIQGLWSSNLAHSQRPDDSLLGLRLNDLLDRQTCDRLKELSRRGVEAGRSKDTECSAALADGVHYFSVRALPVVHAAGKSTALCLLARDVTHRKKSMESLQKSEALLAQAEQLANMGSFDVNLETGEILWSAQLYRAFKLNPATTSLTREFLWQLVHPDDRERVRRDGEMHRTRPQPFEHEARWLRPDGQIRTMYTRGAPVTDSSGRVIRVVGMTQDITERKEAEERLRKSEALLAQAEQLANFGSWELDLKTRKPILSKQLLQMLDIASEGDWTADMYWERMHPKDRQRAREIVDRGLAKCTPYDYISRYRMRDGGDRVHFVRGVPIPGTDGRPERLIGFLQDITDQARAEEDLRRLSQELIRARDEERRHVARELHESAGQSLAALKMTLGRLTDLLPEDNELTHELLQSSIELAESAIREVRTVSYLMHPPMLDEAGLGPALRWYAKGFAERSGIEVEIEIPEDFGRASQEIETTVFRIVQEALTNVHRYSGSRTAKIRLRRKDGQISAEVRDEGCGLAMPGLAGIWHGPPGVGIAGMRERVKQLNGVFELESAPGTGTTVRATLPVTPVGLSEKPINPFHASNA
jgi:signal transduction histidine kinase